MVVLLHLRDGENLVGHGGDNHAGVDGVAEDVVGGVLDGVRYRQIRGLVLHHLRHPSEHPRRLVNRTARRGEPPMNGICDGVMS